MQRKYKICFVISNIRIGGAEKQLVNLINNLDYDKYEVHLLIYAYNGAIPFGIDSKVNIVKNHKAQSIRYKLLKIKD